MNLCKHKWNIIGTSFGPDKIEVDVVCDNCGEIKTALVDKAYEDQVFNQAMKHELLDVPVIKFVDFY